IAVAGSYVYVADSGNNRIERFNLEGGEAMAWGTKGEGPGQFSYPRGVAANASEVLVADDDNHRIEKFDPGGVFQGAAGSRRGAPAPTPPAGCSYPPPSPTAWSRSPRAATCSPRCGTASPRPGRGSTAPPASRWILAGSCTWPTRARDASCACGATEPSSP